MAIIPVTPAPIVPHVPIAQQYLQQQTLTNQNTEQQQTIALNKAKLQAAAQAQLQQQGYDAAVAGGGTNADITSKVQKLGAGPYTDWTQHLEKLNTEQIAQAKSKVDAIKGYTENMSKIADSILSAPEADRPLIYKHAKMTMQNSGDPLGQHLPDQYDPNFLQQFIDADKHLTEIGKGLDNAAKTKEAERKVVENQQKDTKFETDQKQAGLTAQETQAKLDGTLPTDDLKEFNQTGYFQTYLQKKGIDPSSLNKTTEAQQRGQAFIDFKRSQTGQAPTTASLALAAAGGDKTAKAALDILQNESEEGTSITPGSLDMLATQFAKTGQLPPLGMGKSAAADRRQIINAAAKAYPNIDLASNSADYKSNKDSLDKLRISRDQVVSFENTASKNLDTFLSIAPKIVDSGSSWINKPLRSINQGALGSSDLAAYNAARQVAVNEIAKVTSNPALTGQLSDSARKEVEAFIPEDATLAQTLAVAKVLKSDMKARHDSMDEQIAAISSRINAKPGQNTPAPVVAPTAPKSNGAWKVIR